MNGASNAASQSRSPSVLWDLLWALIGGLPAAAAAMFLFAAVLSRANLPAYAAMPLSTLAVCLGAGVSGFLLVRRQRQNGLLLGALVGLLFFGCLVCAAWLDGLREPGALFFIKLLSLVCAGAAGGYGGLLSSEKKKRRRV